MASCPALQFCLFGPKICVSPTQVLIRVAFLAIRPLLFYKYKNSWNYMCFLNKILVCPWLLMHWLDSGNSNMEKFLTIQKSFRATIFKLQPYTYYSSLLTDRCRSSEDSCTWLHLMTDMFFKFVGYKWWKAGHWFALVFGREKIQPISYTCTASF